MRIVESLKVRSAGEYNGGALAEGAQILENRIEIEGDYFRERALAASLKPVTSCRMRQTIGRISASARSRPH